MTGFKKLRKKDCARQREENYGRKTHNGAGNAAMWRAGRTMVKDQMTRLPPDQATADWIVKICSRVELMANRSPRYLVSQTRRPASQLVRAKPASQ